MGNTRPYQHPKLDLVIPPGVQPHGTPIGVDTGNAEEMYVGQVIQKEADGNAALAVAQGNVLGIICAIYKADNTRFRDGKRPASVAAYIEYYAFIAGLSIDVSEDSNGGTMGALDSGWIDLLAQTVENDEPTITTRDLAPFPKVLADSSTAAATRDNTQSFTFTKKPGFDNYKIAGTTDTYYYRLRLTPVSGNIQTP